MRKLLASDIDGTLFVDGKVDNKSIEYIKKFRENGHAFLLSTGRNLGGVKHLLKEYDLEPDGFIVCNGAVVLDKELNVIHNELIDDNILKQIFEEAKDNTEYNFYFSDSENLYVVKGYNSHPMLSMADVEEKMNVVFIDEKDFYKNTYQVNIIGIDIKDNSIEKAKEKINVLQEKFEDKLSMYRNHSFIDIVAKGASKSDGISKVLKAYGVEEDNVFVIGDSWNDLSMFEKYKNSYTFTYAEDELKPHANNIVDNFYDCLENILD